jgi:hypothetical protein
LGGSSIAHVCFGSLQRKSALISTIFLNEERAIHDGLVDQAGKFCALNMKSKPAPADALGLVLYKLSGSPADVVAPFVAIGARPLS